MNSDGVRVTPNWKMDYEIKKPNFKPFQVHLPKSNQELSKKSWTSNSQSSYDFWLKT